MLKMCNTVFEYNSRLKRESADNTTKNANNNKSEIWNYVSSNK